MSSADEIEGELWTLVPTDGLDPKQIAELDPIVRKAHRDAESQHSEWGNGTNTLSTPYLDTFRASLSSSVNGSSSLRPSVDPTKLSVKYDKKASDHFSSSSCTNAGLRVRQPITVTGGF